MSEDTANMRKFFEKKKTEKSLLKDKDDLDLSKSTLSKIQEVPFNKEDHHMLNKQDDSKSIKDFFAGSKIKEKEKEFSPELKKTEKNPKFKKGSPSKPFKFNTLNEKEKDQIFLKYYDENIVLKEKEEKLNDKIKQLSTKLNSIESEFHTYQRLKDDGQTFKENTMAQHSFTDLKSENNRLKEKLKALSTAKKVVSAKPSGKSKNLYSTMANHDVRVNELTRLVDLLKKRLKDSDTQLKQMQENMQKTGNLGVSGDLHSRNVKLASLQNRHDEMLNNLESQKRMSEQTKIRLDELNEQLYKEREENNRLKKEIRGLELSVNHIKDVERKVEDLEKEKQSLSMRLADLCESPFIKEHEERANINFKLRTAESNLEKFAIENKNLNELKFRLETDLERTKKTLDQTQQELKQKIELAADLKANLDVKDRQLGPFKDLERDNDVFLKALGMVKWKGEDPSWYKLDFLERPNKLDVKDPESLLKEIERLRLEKGELAAQLEKSQTLLKIQMESEEENRRIHQSQITQMELQLQSAISRANELSKIADIKGYGGREGDHVYENNGVKYDDRVSVFSDDTTTDIDNDPGLNYLDIWLGEAELDDSSLRNIMKGMKEIVQDPKKILTFLTVDFFNHDTQHSSIAEGTHTNFNFQLAFKVVTDEVFLQYLENGYMKLELYVSEGMEAYLIAKTNIPLKDLFRKTKHEGVAPALSSSITLYGEKNEILGILNYRLRMRYPIGESLKWMKEKRDLGIIEEEYQNIDETLKRKRKLVVVIDKASGLLNKYNSFISYSLEGRDYHTTPQPGQNPKWDYTGIHDINYDETFVGFLKNHVMELMILDDNVPLANSHNVMQDFNDLIGFARISLSGLLNNEILDAIIPITGPKNEKRGTLHIRVFWYEGSLPRKPLPEDSLMTKSWEHDLILRISAALRSKSLNLDSSFRIFDQDRDNLINYHDFEGTLLGTLNMGLHKDEIELFYQRVPKPFNKDSFSVMFGSHLEQNSPTGGMKSNINKINNLLNINTNELNSIQIENIRKIIGKLFADKIRSSSEIALFKELDKNNNGLISILELKMFFLNNSLQLSDDDIYGFLTRVDQNKDNNINLKEFSDYVTAGFNLTNNVQNIKSPKDFNEKSSKDLNIGTPTHIVERLMDEIINYMKNSKKTFLKLYNQIDKDKNNMLSREELKEFLKSIGVKITVKESNVLLNYLDENSDGNIGIKEFIDKIKSHSENKQIYSLFDDEYVPIEIETLNDKIMKYIVDYLVASNISHVDFFNSIDRDNDGFLSRQELNNLFVKTLKLTLNRDEQSSFYNYLDKNRDNKINISEFHSILKPAIEKALSLKNSQKKGSDRQLTDSRRLRFDINEDDLNELKSKIIQYIDSKKAMLMASFKLKEELSEPGFVTLNQFKNILEEISPDYPLNPFTNKEIDIVIDRFCEKNRDKINFESFINLRKTPKQNSLISSSAGSFRDLNRSKQITKEVFGKIAKVVKDEKINVRNAFKTFDLNDDGFISVDELREAFIMMKFTYSEEDIEEIVSLIGNNGKIDYKKFIEALK